MFDQIELVYRRDGAEAAIQYAKQTLSVYRNCARPQKNGRKHFAHERTFRPHFVKAIRKLRIYLRAAERYYV